MLLICRREIPNEGVSFQHVQGKVRGTATNCSYQLDLSQKQTGNQNGLCGVTMHYRTPGGAGIAESQG